MYLVLQSASGAVKDCNPGFPPMAHSLEQLANDSKALVIVGEMKLFPCGEMHTLEEFTVFHVLYCDCHVPDSVGFAVA